MSGGRICGSLWSSTPIGIMPVPFRQRENLNIERNLILILVEGFQEATARGNVLASWEIERDVPF